MPKLTWDGESLTLTDLRLPVEQELAYSACQYFLSIINKGEMERSPKGIKAWVQQAEGASKRSRENRVNAVSQFLGKRKLEEALDVLHEHYDTYLQEPGPQAALFVARALSTESSVMWSRTCDSDSLVLPSLLLAVPGSAVASDEG